MSDLTAAVEAANIAASKALEWLETEPYGDLRANAARAGLIAAQAAVAAAAPLIEAAARADERAKVAEEIARAIEASADGHIGDEYHNATDDAAAIARQHANGMPNHPSHASNPHVARKQPGNHPESHAEPRTGAATSNDTNTTPNPAQTV